MFGFQMVTVSSLDGCYSNIGHLITEHTLTIQKLDESSIQIPTVQRFCCLKQFHVQRELSELEIVISLKKSLLK